MNTHNVDEKRGRRQMLLIYVAIGIIAAVITGWFVYQNRMEYWETQARSAFRVALGKELQKRNEVDVYFSSSGNIRLPDDSIDIKKEPIKVEMESEYGKKDFFVPYEKYFHNVEQSSNLRGMHSYILHMFPLQADSLNRIWYRLLEEMNYSGKTVVRISVADWDERETYTFSDDSLYMLKPDSLMSCYLGYGCEIGVTGYLYYSWLNIFTAKDKILLCALVLCCFLLFFLQEYIAKVYRRFFVKEVTVEKTVPIFVEKEIPMIAVDRSEAHVYRLEDDLFFDADSGVLYRVDNRVKLTATLARLLQAFLDAEDYRLSVNGIMELLWPDGSVTPGNVHTVITRLRKALSEVSDWGIENKKFCYQLKSPISLKKSLNE